MPSPLLICAKDVAIAIQSSPALSHHPRFESSQHRDPLVDDHTSGPRSECFRCSVMSFSHILGSLHRALGIEHDMPEHPR